MSDRQLTPLRQFHDVLEGKPLRHPIHPALVHLPIGLFALGVLFDLASWVAEPANWMVRGAYYTLVFGILTALLAAVFGLADWADIRADHPAKKTATTHMVLNLVAVGLFALSVSLRLGRLD